MRKVRKSKFITVLIVAFCVGFLLVGIRFHPPGQWETAKARWDAQGVENYRYRVGFGSFSWIGSVFITVIKGQVTTIEEDATNPLVYPRPNPPKLVPILANPDWYSHNFARFLPADLSHYKVDGLLDFAAQIQRDHPQPIITVCESSLQWRYEISYNPERGYVEGLRFTDCATYDLGVGLMCGIVSDCSAGFRITDFEALPDV